MTVGRSYRETNISNCMRKSRFQAWSHLRSGLGLEVARSVRKEICLNMGTWLETAIRDEQLQSPIGLGCLVNSTSVVITVEILIMVFHA